MAQPGSRETPLRLFHGVWGAAHPPECVVAPVPLLIWPEKHHPAVAQPGSPATVVCIQRLPGLLWGRGTPPCGLRRLPFLSFLLFCMRCCNSDVMPGTNSSFRDGIFYPASSFWGGECPRGLQGSHPRKVDTGLTRLGHAIRTCSTDVEITPSGCFSPPRGSVGRRPF